MTTFVNLVWAWWLCCSLFLVVGAATNLPWMMDSYTSSIVDSILVDVAKHGFKAMGGLSLEAGR